MNIQILPEPYLNTTQLAERVMLTYTELHDLKYVEIGSDLRIVRASPNIEPILSEPMSHIEGVPLWQAFWEFAGAEAALNDILCGEETSYQLDHVFRTRSDGTSIYLRFRVEPLAWQHPHMGLLLFIEDATASGTLEQSLTQQRNELWLLQQQLSRTNESLKQLNQFKSFVLSMAAHDIANPLNVISVYTNYLLDNPAEMNTGVMTKRLLTAVQRQSQYMNMLLKNLLDLDQVEKGQLKIQKTLCSLNAEIVEIVDTLSALAIFDRANLLLDLSIVPHTISADPGRLHQILYNLINNAVKYTPSGGSIVLRTRLEADQVMFQISDTGYGMTEEQVTNLFQPYYRTEEALESEVSGTGLGLFIVNELVKLHNGRVDVTSELGVGSTFTVRFPVTPNENPKGFKNL